MTRQERARRRAMIVRRWAAYRIGRAQREIWRKRRAAMTGDLDDGGDVDDAAGTDDGLAELPDALLG